MDNPSRFADQRPPIPVSRVRAVTGNGRPRAQQLYVSGARSVRTIIWSDGRAISQRVTGSLKQ